MSARARIVLFACTVEGALLGVAALLGMALSVPAFAELLRPPSLTVLAGTPLATLPMLGLLGYCMRSSARACVRIREVVERSLVPLFARSTTFDLFIVSCAAGLCEEVLFRGVLQQAATRAFNEGLALAACSVLFGLAHAVTLGYALFATAMGLYLGLLYTLSGDLWLPVLSHALYDFWALCYLRRST